MIIELLKGVGKGKTLLSAFDAAIMDAGIANYNLIRLSSIIPPKSKIIVSKKRKAIPQEFGHRLYVVMARMNQEKTGKLACAGMGWVQQKDGRGLFVEHSGESEKQVIGLIKLSLIDLMKRRPAEYSKINYLVSKIKCQKNPICAVVAAVYKSEEWK